MSPTGPHDFRIPDLRIVPSSMLVPHEREDESRAGRLSERLKGSGVLKNPPVVTEVPDTGKGGCLVVLDGANRVSAARASDLPHFLVQVVRYDDPSIQLMTWHHALSGYPPEELKRELARIPGLTLRKESLGHARALLARREAIAYVVTGEDGAITLCGDRSLQEQNALLNAVVDLYRDRVPFYRVARDSLSEARARFRDVTALLVFPRFHPDEILDIATSGARLPAGITRHLIPWRALRVNVPLEILSDPARSLDEKNRWLKAWIEERVVQKNVRFYEESTVLFDE
jgi:hypothetical protein